MNLVGRTADRVVTVCGQRGVEWLDRLPRLVSDLAAEWQLSEVGAPFVGARASFVAPVVDRDGAALVLKLTPLREWLCHEASALRYWDGGGAVRMRRVDIARGAMLIERAMPGRSLVSLAVANDRAATEVASRLIATLQRNDAPPPDDLPTIESWLDHLRVLPASGVSAALVAAAGDACAVADDLLRTSSCAVPGSQKNGARVVLHGDLHHENVLSIGDDGWIAADPKGLTGPREIEAAALLRNPRRYVLAHSDPAALTRDRLHVLADQVGFDPARTAAWGYVLAVVAATFAFEDVDGETEVSRWLAFAAIVRGVA